MVLLFSVPITTSLRVIPVPSIVLNQSISLWRTPGACRVGVDSAGRHVLPGIDDAVHDAPGRLGLVTANEERRVTNHTVCEQAFVRVRRFDAKGSGIGEVHVNVAE